MAQPRIKWTQADYKRIKKLRTGGTSWREIAEIFSPTKKAQLEEHHPRNFVKRFESEHGEPYERERAGMATPHEEATTGDIPEPIDIEELKQRRSAEFARKKANYDAKKLIPVKVNIDGPIGIAHFGDPHIDDPGCDIDLLYKHAKLVRNTPGLFGGNIGDTTNNWVGRLAALYANQATTAKEAWALAEDWLKECEWLYMIAGNHDLWSGARDPLHWIMKGRSGIHNELQVRMGLSFPNGNKATVHIRHHFKGNSMWNTAHGPNRAAQMGWRDHILACGHIHTSGYQVVKDPASGIVSHCLRVAAYKMIDTYAIANNFEDGHIFCCPVTIIDPRKSSDSPSFVTTCFDPEEGADRLTWLRARKS